MPSTSHVGAPASSAPVPQKMTEEITKSSMKHKMTEHYDKIQKMTKHYNKIVKWLNKILRMTEKTHKITEEITKELNTLLDDWTL
jgi:DNA-binding transcriptional regulator GbsR (MarR family)